MTNQSGLWLLLIVSAAMVGERAIATSASAGSAINTGEYVARAADCMSCHTASPDRPFAGGYPVKSPLGIIYGPNITPDADTGIGSWTQADFERALRQGIRKDGAYLYPAMPYGSYTKMSEADMTALWKYIHGLRPIRNQVPKNTLPFPFTVRSGLSLWRDLYFTPGPFVPVTDKGEAWNRGAYLVEALGHCADCHTPRNIALGPEAKRHLAGGEIQGWYAPDIIRMSPDGVPTPWRPISEPAMRRTMRRCSVPCRKWSMTACNT